MAIPSKQGPGCLPPLLGSVVLLGIGFWLVDYSGWAWLLIIAGSMLGLVAWSIHKKSEELALRERLRTEYPGLWKWTDSYQEVREKVLQRDCYRCRQCGRADGIEVHHLTRRSAGGADEPGNLITLCWRCHDSKHPGARKYHIMKHYKEKSRWERNRRK